MTEGILLLFETEKQQKIYRETEKQIKWIVDNETNKNGRFISHNLSIAANQ